MTGALMDPIFAAFVGMLAGYMIEAFLTMGTARRHEEEKERLKLAHYRDKLTMLKGMRADLSELRYWREIHQGYMHRPTGAGKTHEDAINEIRKDAMR